MLRISTIALLALFVFFSCQEKERTTQTQIHADTIDTSEFLAKGAELTGKVQATLLKRLSSIIQKEGTAHAIGYCHLHALPMIDSMILDDKTAIVRITNKYRNRNDAPSTDLDAETLAQYEASSSRGEQINPMVRRGKDGTVTYYAPIKVALPTCLKCHGDPRQDIDPATLEKIDQLYPKDLARNYKLGDFRGAWKVTF